MAFLEVNNVKIAGIAAGVPQTIVSNLHCSNRISEEYDNREYVASTGVEERRYDGKTVVSDLFKAAADRLLDDLKWSREEIDAIIVVTQTPDYILPPTSCILQHRIGAPKECFTLDISLGCSGWVYGMSVLSSLMRKGTIRRGLLMAGDARWHVDYDDPLFGYAGTVTALEAGDGTLRFYCGCDGSGYDAIIIPDGGARNPINEHSFEEEQLDGTTKKNRLVPRINGMDVFSFGISTAPKSVRKLCTHFNINMNGVDYFLFHQANKKMNGIISKKLGLEETKVPVGLTKFGNTSAASIPLAMVTEIGDVLKTGRHSMLCCGFGVGLSWGAAYVETDNLVVSPLVEI